MALKLQYRSTFIDVEEKSEESVRVRAQSLPAKSRTPTTEVHEEESQLSNYVIALAQRAEQLCVLLRRDGNLAQLKEEPVEEPKKRQQFRMETETSSTKSTTTPHHASELEQFSSKASDSHQELSPVSPWQGRSRQDFASGSLADEVLPFPGSLGHPEVCRRPCLYYAAGNCSNGASCGYCHMPHTQRPPHLDKQQREVLKKLSDADVLKMLARQLRGRAAERGFSAEASEVLNLMDSWAMAAVQVRAHEAAAPAGRHLAKLEHHLSKMTFSSLLGLAIRGQSSSESIHKAEVADALNKMRARLASAGMCQLQPWEEQCQ